MTFFSVLRQYLIKKAAKDIKPEPMDAWLERQRIVAAEFEKQNLKKTISKKKPKAIKPASKSKPKKRRTKAGRRAKN